MKKNILLLLFVGGATSMFAQEKQSPMAVSAMPVPVNSKTDTLLKNINPDKINGAAN